MKFASEALRRSACPDVRRGTVEPRPAMRSASCSPISCSDGRHEPERRLSVRDAARQHVPPVSMRNARCRREAKLGMDRGALRLLLPQLLPMRLTKPLHAHPRLTVAAHVLARGFTDRITLRRSYRCRIATPHAAQIHGRRHSPHVTASGLG
jgi:hypothetical protein